MPEIEPRVGFEFFPICSTRDANATQVLVVLARNKGGIGLTQEELVKLSGLTSEDALREVGRLEKAKYVHSFICQEGTAGPFARRYQLVKGAEIKVVVTMPVA